MRKTYYLIVTALVSAVFLLPAQAIAQDDNVMVVPWLDGNDVAINSLYEAIVSDTTETGERANPDRIYQLEQGGFYYNTERIENNGFHLRIVGEAGDPSDPFKNPPMIQVEHREDGNRTDKMFRFNGDVTLENVIINGKTTLGDLPYEIISFDAGEASYMINNVIFEYAGWGIMGFYGTGSEISITNSTFRNLLSHNQPWGGRGFSVWTDVEKVVVENNTFLNVGGFAMQIEGGVANELWVNHNTFVNVGRQPVLYPWHKNSYFTNNLIVNGWWHGEGSEGFDAIRLEEPDNQYTGMIYIDELPTRYGLDVERVVVISNNSVDTDQPFVDFFDSTSGDDFPLRQQPFVNVRTQNYADTYDNILIQNTFEDLDPGLATYPDNYSEMTDFITAVRGESETIPLWYWDPGRDDDNYSIQWPLPEDLSYSNTTHQAAGFGGYPLGNLNWFPDAKADWEAEKDEIEAEIRGLVGEPPVLVNKGALEFEDGTLGGDAMAVEMDAKQLVRVAGSGDPYWEFTMEAAATYDVEIKHRTWYADNNPSRQTDLYVNDMFVAPFTVGMEITDDLPWAFALVEGVSFEEGMNSLKLGKSWGYMEYESVTLKNGDDVVMVLRGSKAVLNGADRVCSGALCASGDFYADVTGGSVEISGDFDAAGSYVVQLSFINPDGSAATADIMVNGASAGSVTFEGASDAFTTLSLNDVAMVEGTNTLKIENVSGSLGLDVVDFFLLETPTSVETEQPEGFELSQNFPNPFNPSTQINFSLPATSDVTLEVYNILGQRVATLASGLYSAGLHTVSFDASTMASGTYLYRMDAGEFVQVRKMMLIK